MASIRPRRLSDGTERYDVSYSQDNRTTSVTFDNQPDAAAYLHVVELRHRRCWPVEPLVERSGLTVRQLAEAHGLGKNGASNITRLGLTDIQADHWATAAGLHPAQVWGWDWVTAAHPAEGLGQEAVA